uniref:Uncharacterized protein n=1 Tax=Romanomermis culicivorax TaxID=13658 RepID=A0A915JL26_ROMCU
MVGVARLRFWACCTSTSCTYPYSSAEQGEANSTANSMLSHEAWKPFTIYLQKTNDGVREITVMGTLISHIAKRLVCDDVLDPNIVDFVGDLWQLGVGFEFNAIDNG